MQRPSFRVVTGTVIVLALVGVASRLLERRIPRESHNQMGFERSEFLTGAATQRIDWQKPTSEAFAEARRRDLPIFLVVGTPCSHRARELDSGPLQQALIQNYLARNFICMRVDAFEFPEYRNLFLPVSRASAEIAPGLQMWILDPAGRLLDYIRASEIYPLDENTNLLNALVRGRSAFERADRPLDGQPTTPQTEELAKLKAAMGANAPNFRSHIELLESLVLPKTGGFPSPAGIRLTPEAFRFLLLSGRRDLFARATTGILTSPLVDPLDGGFFNQADPELKMVWFDKTAASNSGMLRVLVQSQALGENEFHRLLAIRTFDMLADQFSRGGLLAACQIGKDTGAFGRSSRYSFGPRRLQQVLPDSEGRAWAEANLGMNPRINVTMSPAYVAPDQLFKQKEKLNAILEKLRSAERPEPTYAGTGLMDQGGYAVARLIEAARILGDGGRLAEALTLAANYEQFRSVDDVWHSTLDQIQGRLTDYLAYSDLQLQTFLATGNYDSLQKGTRVLARALFLFGTPERGWFQLTTGSDSRGPQEASSPEIVDWYGESASAQIIRLTRAYGLILRGTGQGESFRRHASDVVARFALPTEGLGQDASAFFTNAAALADGSYVVTVGRDAQTLADRIARKAPHRLAFACFGDIRRDIQAKGAGIYIVTDAQVDGPLSSDAAIKRLSQPYSIGL